jgi:hypothetical protein
MMLALEVDFRIGIKPYPGVLLPRDKFIKGKTKGEYRNG